MISDDLPAPLSPMTARISPARSSKSAAVERGDVAVALDESARLHHDFDTGRGLSTGFSTALISGSPLRDSWSTATAEDHEDAGDQHLVDRRHAHQREPVAEHADDQRADQRAEHDAAPAEQAGAAEHDRGDGIEVLGLPGVRVADAGARHRQQRRDAVEHAGQHVDAEQHAFGRDAGQPRRLGVVADRVDVPARRRFRAARTTRSRTAAASAPRRRPPRCRRCGRCCRARSSPAAGR